MDGNHTVRMSEGYISGDKITVTRGPLMGFEGDIRKIDRHKRRAYIDVTLFGRTAWPTASPNAPSTSCSPCARRSSAWSRSRSFV